MKNADSWEIDTSDINRSGISKSDVGKLYLGCKSLIEKGEYKRIRDAIIEDRKERGIKISDEQWFTVPLTHWVKTINNSSVEITPRDLLCLMVGISDNLALRDALVISILSVCTVNQLVGLTTHPHRETSVELICNALEPAFRDKNVDPRTTESARAAVLITVLTWVCLPKTDLIYTIQPLAMLAYIAWWQGKAERSVDLGECALRIDPQCCLAKITVAASQIGIKPAWLNYSERDND